uniref:Pre-mRNA-splicing factor 38 n=1 Tax=Moniliophthora roreri TaxID=221103 RepID=A0A0W0G801_MONRR
MANTTVTGAKAIHGQNPQFLVETVIRNRIYESSYWKEHCFALTGKSHTIPSARPENNVMHTAESLIDKAIELKCIGGVYGNQRPTEFLCLLLKLLQIQPEKEILIEYLQADEFKYLRALAAMYIRMTFGAAEVYQILEPLLKDYRKLRLRNMTGYILTFMDEFVDSLLTEERVCDIILPRLIKRQVLEENGDIGPRKSRLLDALEGNSDIESNRGRRTEALKEKAAQVVRVQVPQAPDTSPAVLHSQGHGRDLDPTPLPLLTVQGVVVFLLIG